MPLQDRYRTGDQALVREINLSLIINRLLTQDHLSRAALADATGLNKSTVSSLVHELLALRFVREVGFSSSGIGRPSMQLELNPEAGFILSCEIGVDFISVVCANFRADMIWRHKEDTRHDRSQTTIIERVLAILRQGVEVGQAYCAHCRGRLLGISIGMPGLVDCADGTLLSAPNLRWQNVPMRALIREAFPDTPVFVDNEANMAALGECFFGAAQGYKEVLFISAGAGLGGAVVNQGELFRGKTGFAGEFGHMTVDPAGLPCNCGNRGCWETMVSQSAVFRHIRQSLENGRASVLRAMTGNDPERLSIPLVVEAARDSDPVALDALERVGHDLGIGTASLVNALNPDLVVFGGILSLAGEFLLPAVRQELAQRALSWNAAAADVILSQHGFDACVMGGIAIVLQAILAQPGNYGSRLVR